MPLFLGIDGGGTGCRAAVADSFGRILGTGVAGPANIASDLAGASQSILEATKQALAEAGGLAAPADLMAGLGLAGANAAGVADRLRETLPFARLRIETDAVAAVKGALGGDDGIVAALGTGSVFASQRGGQIRQIGGWGLVLGDDGSGARLGRGLLAAALGAVDGYRAMTPLLAEVLREQGGAEGVIAFSLRARPAEFAALAPRIVGSRDPVAQELVAEAVEDVARSIALLQGGAPLPVTYLGGLGPTYATRLGGRWAVREPLGSALDGALLLAREAA
ncbi:MAG: ATPase [Tabrizicola sp.]|jgi:glucosamine kinase|nr:ATPase [Tabrizicola sp.]